MNIRFPIVIGTVALLTLACIGIAQATRDAAQPASVADTKSPYIGAQPRQIKALSSEEVAALRAGRGAGMAMPAELNGYPGPRHALDLADALALSPAQRQELTAEFERMHERAIALGARLIDAETALDRTFAEGTATAPEVESLDARIGILRGKLRTTHLLAHVAAHRILSVEQRRRYAQLRGYAPG